MKDNLTEKARVYLHNTEPSDDLFLLKLDWESKQKPTAHPFIYHVMADFTTQELESLQQENKRLEEEVKHLKNLKDDPTMIKEIRLRGREIKELKHELQQTKEKLKRCEELLQESVIQLQYLNDEFGETGTTNQLLSKLISQLKDND